MATTQIKTLRSLKKSLIYAQNLEKTDKSLITGIECTPETAYQEFTRVKEIFNNNKGITGYVIYQNFKPGETTEKIAHEIGKKLVEKFLKEKYQSVVVTHKDKKHLHNHIIFNSVSMEDGKKYRSDIGNYYKLRDLSDKLCKEYGLSVIKNPINRGKSYKEWLESKRNNSWKDKIKNDIDLAIKETSNYEKLITHLLSKGYRMKKGKYLSFRPPFKERYIRDKMLGYDYTEDGIKERFEFKKLRFDIVTIKSGQKIKNYRLIRTEKRKIYHSKSIIKLSFIIAIVIIKRILKQKNLKVHAKIINDKTLVRFEKQLNLINKEKINTLEDYNKYLDNHIDKMFNMQRERRMLSTEKRDLKDILGDLDIIKKYIKFVKSRKDSPEKRAFKAARERLLNKGIEDTSVEKSLKNRLLKIEEKSLKLRNNYTDLEEEKELLDEIENTINKITKKEKPFNLKKDDISR